MKFLLGMVFLAHLFLGEATGTTTPSWFADFEKSVPGCDQNYLCTMGEGASLNEALGMSRNEAAKFFSTKVQSSSQVWLRSEQKGSIANSNFSEWTNKVLNEETSEILSGLEIKKQEEKEGRFYVVMGLDKNKTAAAIKSRIDKLDSENALAFDLNSRFAYPKIFKNLSLIDELINRHRLISPAPIGLKVKREQVLDKVRKLKPLKLSLQSKGKKMPVRLNHTLNDLLSPLRIVLVPMKSAPTYTLVSDIVFEDQYLKVEGFKKLNVNLKLELKNSSQKTLGKISALSEQVARTNEQAFERALPELKTYLEDHLDELIVEKSED